VSTLHAPPQTDTADRPETTIAVLEVLYGHVPIIALGNALLSLANVVAYSSKLPATSLLVYLVATNVVVGLRLLLLLYYRRFAFTHRSAQWHLTAIQLSSLVNGMVWGGWSWYVVDQLPAGDLLAMVLIQAGMCAGVVSTSSASRLGLAFFVTAALAPLGVHQALYGGLDGKVSAIVLLLYLILTLASSNRIYKTIYDSIELAHTNRTLAEELYHSSNTDGLTGLANRRYLDYSLEKLVNLRNRHNLQLVVLMIDVDDFKAFNDTRGHLAGDTCLKLIARTAESVFSRKEDLVARYGGEEFVVLIPGVSTADAMGLAEEFLRRVRGLELPYEVPGRSSRITVSIGMADSDTEHALSPEDYLECADQALYRAKSEGKNRVCRVEASPEQQSR
jgi:diguanylate cyclase (GGDEF)-like protein